MYIPVTPIAKPRMTQSDKWKQRPAVMKYRDYKDKLRESGVVATETMWLVFAIPMPQSWSLKKKAAHMSQPHRQKPDIDNLVKGFLDALLVEDEAVWEVHAMKIWGYEGGIHYGQDSYATISQATQIQEARPNAVKKQSETLGAAIGRVAGHRSVRMRGVLPGARKWR